jgi:hypothetical protein
MPMITLFGQADPAADGRGQREEVGSGHAKFQAKADGMVKVVLKP